MNCLMIMLKDKRKFLTSQSNLKHLIEFAKTFHAELSIVSVEGIKTLPLERLAAEICDTNAKNEDFEYKVVRRVSTKENAASTALFNHIVRVLRSGRCVDESKVVDTFRKKGMDDSSIHSHINRAMRYLSSLGFRVRKSDGKIAMC